MHGLDEMSGKVKRKKYYRCQPEVIKQKKKKTKKKITLSMLKTIQVIKLKVCLVNLFHAFVCLRLTHVH